MTLMTTAIKVVDGLKFLEIMIGYYDVILIWSLIHNLPSTGCTDIGAAQRNKVKTSIQKLFYSFWPSILVG